MNKLFISFILLFISISCNVQNNENIEKYVDRVFYNVDEYLNKTNYFIIFHSERGILPVYFDSIGISFKRIFAYAFITNTSNDYYYYSSISPINHAAFHAIKFNKDKMYLHTINAYTSFEISYDNITPEQLIEESYSNTYILAKNTSEEEKYILDIINNSLSGNENDDNYIRIRYYDYNYDKNKDGIYIEAFNKLFGLNDN